MLAAKKIVQLPAARALSTKAAPGAVIKQATSSNGVRIISREKDSGVVSFQVAVVGGSSTEAASQKGAAQLLASAAFAGSAKRSGIAIVNALEGLGARFSATSTKDAIVYDVSVTADNAAAALASVLELVGPAPAEKYHFKEAKAAAALHYAARAGKSCQLLNELVHEAAFGEVSGYGNSGFATNLDNLCIDEVLAYRQAHFARENIIVATNGGVTVDAVQTLVNTHAGGIAAGKAAAFSGSAFVGGEVKVRADLNGASHLAVAFASPAGEAGKAYQVLASVLNARVASKSICAGAFSHSYAHGGLFGVRTSGNSATATEQLTKVVGELKAIAGGAPETDGAKAKLALDGFLSLDSTHAPGLLVRSVLTKGNVATAVDFRTVSSQAVADAAKAVLKATPAYAVYGSTVDVPSYSAVQKLLA